MASMRTQARGGARSGGGAPGPSASGKAHACTYEGMQTERAGAASGRTTDALLDFPTDRGSPLGCVPSSVLWAGTSSAVPVESGGFAGGQQLCPRGSYDAWIERAGTCAVGQSGRPTDTGGMGVAGDGPTMQATMASYQPTSRPCLQAPQPQHASVPAMVPFADPANTAAPGPQQPPDIFSTLFTNWNVEVRACVHA